jgi:Ran GTPase-activating protein (RanGAP) involved in mRNA processing and transport
MKPAQEIASQTTAQVETIITDREQVSSSQRNLTLISSSSSSPTEEAVLDEATETTPLHPKQLQQFLQQLNWQEQDLTVAGIFSTLLTEELNRSWYSRLNHWFLREPLLFKILQWPFSKVWPAGSVLPTGDERLLKRIYGVNGYLEGTDLMLNKVWSSLLLSFLVVDIYSYYRYPNLRFGNTLLKVFLAQTDNQQMLSSALTLPEAWPLLLGIPVLWGVLKAFLSARHAKAVDKAAYRTLLETLGHYQASLWKDIGRWVLPSLLPEFVPNLALFALLPEPKLKLALESAERLLLWDHRINPDERRILLQQVQVLTRKATHITQLKALITLAKVADGIAPNDLVRLSQQGVDAESLKSLLWVKQQAKQTLQQAAQSPSTQPLFSSLGVEPLINLPLDDKLTTPSRSRYLYTHYLLWTLGQPHDYRLQPLFWGYLTFQGYFKARFFYSLGRGMYDTFNYYWDKWQCESEGKLWSYFNERADWECSFCGDLPLFYNDVFNETTCWEAYIANPRPVKKLVELIERLSFVNLPTIDLSRQHLENEGLITLLDALLSKANRIQTLLLNDLNDSAFPLPPLNATAIQAITNLLRNSTVKKLSLQGRQIQATDTPWLARALPYSPIQSLDLSGNNYIGAEGAKEIGQVLNRSQVQFLYLVYNNIGAEGAKGLAQGLPGSQVQFLYLVYNNIGDEGAKGLAQGLPGSQVQSLDLSYNNIGYEGAIGLAQGLPGSQVQSLDLSGNKIGEEGAKELAQGLSGSQVQFLYLVYNNIGAEGATRLAQRLPGSQVQHLDLRDNYIGAEGAKGLAQGLPGSQVQHLDLSDNYIGAEGAKGLAQGLPGSQVQHLDLSDNYIGAEGATRLAEGLPGSQVQSLYLRWNNISDEGATRLAQGLPGSQVQVLDLSYNNIGAEGAKRLAQGLPGSQVQVLDLSYNNIGDEGAKGLAQGLLGSQVHYLDLSWNFIDAEGAIGLAQGLLGSQVQSLYLRWNNISDEGAKRLAQGLPGSQVQHLDLSDNYIGAEGAKGLAQGLPGSQVQHLDLSDNNIGDEGAKGLAQGLPGSQVQSLDLSDNNIGYEGAIGLAQGLPGSQVQSLDLSGNKIGEEGAKQLANVMVKGSLNAQDLVNILTPDSKKALARAEPNTPLEMLLLSSNNITTQGARALCWVLPQTHINQFSLGSNPINSSQVDPQTCFISSSAASLQPTGPYATLYHLYQATLRYATEGYQYIATYWPTTTLSPSPTHNKAQDQFSSSLDSISNPVEEVPSDSPDFLPKKMTISESPIINNAPSEINENEPLFTFKITSVTLVESTMATPSSSLLEPTNRSSKNPFSFFNTLAKTSSPVAQSLNSSFPALPKPIETLSTVNTLGVIGAAVTGFLAVGYWAWKNIKRNNTTAMAVSEKTANSQPEVKTPKSIL